MSGPGWFRTYSRIVDDEKLRLLAFEDRWHFIALCALKNEGLLEDSISDLRSRKIAVRMGVQVRELEEIGRRLFEVGLVDEFLHPKKWDELQAPSDNSAARVKKFREKQRLAKEKRPRNVTVTECNGYSNALEEDVEEDLRDSNESHVDLPDENEVGLELTPEHLQEAWNASPAANGAVECKRLKDNRRRKAVTFLRKWKVDEITEAIGSVGKSAFLCGQTKEGFRADISFLFSEEHMNRLLEGFYAR